jgi:hypothetical protein
VNRRGRGTVRGYSHGGRTRRRNKGHECHREHE